MGRREGKEEGRSKERKKGNLPICEEKREDQSALKGKRRSVKDREWSRNA